LRFAGKHRREIVFYLCAGLLFAATGACMLGLREKKSEIEFEPLESRDVDAEEADPKGSD
jgi:hypothetical protein